MHVVNDFRGVLQMTLNVLNRKAEAEPVIGDIAYELKRSGGYMVDFVSELEASLEDFRNHSIPVASMGEGRKLKHALKAEYCKAVRDFASWLLLPENIDRGESVDLIEQFLEEKKG